MKSTHQEFPRSALAPVKGQLCAVAVFSLFSNMLLLAPSIYMLQVYDRVLNSRSLETLVMLTIVLLGLLLVQGGLEKVRSGLLVRVGTIVETQLRDIVLTQQFKHVVNTDSRAEHAGVRDLRELRGFLAGPALIALLDSPWVPFYVVVIYLMHPILGMIALGGAVFLFVLAYANDVITRAPLKASAAAGEKYSNDVNNAMRNIDSIEAMGMLPVMLRRWRTRGDAAIAPAALASQRAGSTTAIAKFFRLAIQSIVLGTGVALVIDPQATSGVIIASSILLGRALAPVENAISHWRSALSAWSAMRRINDALRQVTSTTPVLSLPAPAGRIDVAGLHYAHPGRDALCVAKIEFSLRAGEALGIMGPSGCGKSTLLRLLVGAINPAAGTIRIDGADLNQWGEARGRYIGYLAQDVQLFDGTVWENICRMDGEPESAEIVRAARCASVHELILQLPDGYQTQVGVSGSHLSGGQQRMIGLSRCMYRSPRVIVMDEPAANLDGDGEQAVRQAIAHARTTGATVIVVSHQMSVLQGMDTFMVMQQGSIKRYGPRVEVLRELQVIPGRAGGGKPSAVPAHTAVVLK